MKRKATIYACAVLVTSLSSAQTTIQFTAIHALPSNQVELMWASDTNRWYAIERTADLTNWSYEFDFVIPDDSAPIESNHWLLATDTTPCFFRVFASSPVEPQDNVCTNIGSPSNDTQIVIGTTNMDYVIQYEEGSNDTQYASTGEDYDWIAQYGGTGEDTQTARGGSASDWIFQDGGVGNDLQSAEGGDDSDWIIQRGGDGDDEISTSGGWGNDILVQLGGRGTDVHSMDSGDGDDSAIICGGDGADDIRYDWSVEQPDGAVAQESARGAAP